jgi:hypothetical protein
MKYHAAQLLLPLTQAIAVERGISLVCIPDRDTAECELTRLRHQFGPDLVKATIRKDKPAKCASSTRATYTLRYFIRETQHQRLF